MNDEMPGAYRKAIELAAAQYATLRVQPEWYHLARLMRETGKLAEALMAGDWSDAEGELTYIASICLNWLRATANR